MNITQEVQLSLIDIPECFRQHTMESVDALAQDIQRNGQLQEIVVTPKDGGRYELVAGKRRTLAMRHLNWEKVRAQVMENLNELQKALIMIAENDEREDVNPFDRALSYQRAVNAGVGTQKEMAERLGLSEQAVSNTLALLGFSPEQSEDFRQRKLSGSHLGELLRLPDADSQTKMAHACDEQGWSVKVLRDKVSRALAGGPAKADKTPGELATDNGPFQFVKKGKFLNIRTTMPTAVEEVDEVYMRHLRIALADFVAKEHEKGAHMDQAA